jgi:hypothetical protein
LVANSERSTELVTAPGKNFKVVMKDGIFYKSAL